MRTFRHTTSLILQVKKKKKKSEFTYIRTSLFFPVTFILMYSQKRQLGTKSTWRHRINRAVTKK